MERPEYLSKYYFDWELFEVIIGGKSSLDAKSFLGEFATREKVYSFLDGYGFNQENPILKAELFGNFQEAMQFIRRYFLRENNPQGLDLTVPNAIYGISEVSDLFLMAAGREEYPAEERLWAGVILKVMHTIIHADKDLRHNYFSVIQQQILDRFYRYIKRDHNDQLCLSNEQSGSRVGLVDFQTKAKKSRDSIILKLLHKAENVAEEVFDRVGVRFITKRRIDTLRVIKFLQENYVVMPHNIKPSRSLNSLIDLDKFKHKYRALLRQSFRQKLTEEEFLEVLEKEVLTCVPSSNEERPKRNAYTSTKYRSIQFTCRHLVSYQNPFMGEFNKVRRLARKAKDEGKDDELAQMLLNLDVSLIAKEVRFFYPFEVQIVDEEVYKENSLGEASHQDYKKIQLKAAMLRLFRPLIEYKKIKVD